MKEKQHVSVHGSPLPKGSRRRGKRWLLKEKTESSLMRKKPTPVYEVGGWTAECLEGKNLQGGGDKAKQYNLIRNP